MTDQEQLLITKYDLLFESRLTKVETSLLNAEINLGESIKEIKSDLRWMFGIMLGFGSALLLLMAKGFHWFI